jgi:hypothetical protein
VVFSGTVPRWHPRWRRSRGPLSAASLRVVTARTPHRHALLAETNNAEKAGTFMPLRAPTVQAFHERIPVRWRRVGRPVVSR